MIMMIPTRLIIMTTLASSLMMTLSCAFVPPALDRIRHQQHQKPSACQLLASSSQTPPPRPEKMNPPLSKKEIQEWLDYVPVYTITDSEGKLVYVKPSDNEPATASSGIKKKIFTFYISRTMADATLSELKTNQISSSSSTIDLKLSAFALGQIWFDLLMSKSVSEEEEFRLVANDQDLLGARMLLTMGPEEEEQLLNASSLQEEEAILEAINTKSPKFKAKSFNQIPVFMISQMRFQQQKQVDKKQSIMTPMYLNNEDMITSWQSSGQQQKQEPSFSLMELHEIVGMMSTECAFDFRSAMLMPPSSSIDDDDNNTGGRVSFGQGIQLP